MAKYDLEKAIVHALNENTKDYGGNVKFDFTSRRASAAALKSCSGIDKIKVTMKNKKPFLNVMFYKNFTDVMGGWQSCLDSSISKIKSAILKAGLGQTFDVAAGEVVGSKKVTTFDASDDQGQISKESQMSAQLSALAGQLMLGDFDELDQSSVLRKFMMIMRSGDAVLIPESTWKSSGLSKAAAQMRIQSYRQDTSSKILAVARQDLKKVCESINFTLTEDLTLNVKGSIQQMSTNKLMPLTPALNEQIIKETKQFTEQINSLKRQQDMLANPDKAYKELLSTRDGVRGKDGSWVSEPQTLTDLERRTLNLLTAVVEKGMISMLNKKRQDLEASISALNASRNAKEAEIRGTISSEVDDASAVDVVQIVQQKAGSYKYYLALYFNGKAVKF